MKQDEALRLLQGQVEVESEVVSTYLGVTPRMVTNYLRSGQLHGEKVGVKWFIKSDSVLRFRSAGQPLQEVVLPSLENPLSEHQEKRKNHKSKETISKWELRKGPKRDPRKLGCYFQLQECYQLLLSLEDALSLEDFAFFKSELLVLGDDLGAGFYSFGVVKRKLYARARLRAGRLVSRAVLSGIPQGLFTCLCSVVEGIAALCKTMDAPYKKSGVKKEEGSHVA